MAGKKSSIGFSDEAVINKILLLRNKKVMIDSDLAELYGISTKRLNEQVRRNSKRFPEDFMFTLTAKEKDGVIRDNKHLKNLKFSTVLPNVFTEYGVVMLASVLNSERAIEVNIQIVRIFTRLREMLLSHKDVLLKLEQVERKLTKHDDDIRQVFVILKKLIMPVQKTRTPIGFKRAGK